MMIGMDTLFNQVPGCVITSGSVTGAPAKRSQELNYACETNSGSTHPRAGPRQIATWTTRSTTLLLKSPRWARPTASPSWSSVATRPNTGIGTAFSTTNQQQVSTINYARSSRDPSSGNDIQGLNFVAYAKDGVAPLIWAEANSVKTPFASHLTSGLTTARSCRASTTARTTTGPSSAPPRARPIFVYSAQEGSGTQATFKTFLGFDPSASRTGQLHRPGCHGRQGDDRGVHGRTGQDGTLSPADLDGATGARVRTSSSRTRMPPILANATTSHREPIATAWSTTVRHSRQPDRRLDVLLLVGQVLPAVRGPQGRRSTYLDKSTDRWRVKARHELRCLTAADRYKPALTPVNGIAANPQRSWPRRHVYPIDRFLYNVYSNGSNANIPSRHGRPR